MDFLKKLFGMGGGDGQTDAPAMSEEEMDEQAAAAVEGMDSDQAGEMPAGDNSMPTDDGAM